ncbi:MAG: DUF2721 domain-containing protein [Anaerolineae bacterium]|nr:MAG: DUF2721 domain-containing protein [Anaerolineae bacterium]
MPTPSVEQLLPILQTAVGPVILVSGVGLLLLTMTNRLGRVIDRGRSLAQEHRTNPNADQERILTQLMILNRRAALIRRAITLASLSVLLAAILVIVIFLTALFHWEVSIFLSGLFITCMLALIGSLIAFIQDLNLSLDAYQYDIKDVMGKKSF